MAAMTRAVVAVILRKIYRRVSRSGIVPRPNGPTPCAVPHNPRAETTKTAVMASRGLKRRAAQIIQGKTA
jgi:hypothetical protein